MQHVDEGTLHALLDGALRAHEPERADRVEAHLETCADCRARLEAAATLREEASGILDATDTTVARPDFEEVRARAGATAPDIDETRGTPGGGPAGTGLRRQYRWTRGLAWAATIVVALGTGYMARDLVGPTGEPVSRTTDAIEADRSAAQAERGPSAEGPDERSEAERPAAEAPSTEPDADAAPAGQPPTDVEAPARDAGADRQDAPSEPARARTPVAEEEQAAPAEGGGRRLEAARQEPEAVPEPGAAGTRDGFTAAASVLAGVTDWVEVDLPEAERRLGAPVLLLPRARITRVLAAAGGEPTVQSLQLLPGDVTIRVVQQPGASTPADDDDQAADDEPAGAPARAEAPAEARALRADAAVTLENTAVAKLSPSLDSVRTDEMHTVAVDRIEALLILAGPLTPEILTALAVAARPGQ